MTDLPSLEYENLLPTRDFLQDAGKVLGKLQQVFLQPMPHDWHYGLEVGMRGPLTQEFQLKDHAMRGSLDLVQGKLRLGTTRWRFDRHSPPELLNNVKVWLESQQLPPKVAQPEFSGSTTYDPAEAGQYAQALWWMHEQFSSIKQHLDEGLTSPILLFPHHFDLSLVWFPHDTGDKQDERQLSLGWSTGDETIAEPYVYLTAYPEPAGFTRLPLPEPAYWQTEGFSGAIIKHNDLVTCDNPAATLIEFAAVMRAAAPLLVKPA